MTEAKLEKVKIGDTLLCIRSGSNVVAGRYYTVIKPYYDGSDALIEVKLIGKTDKKTKHAVSIAYRSRFKQYKKAPVRSRLEDLIL